MYGTRSSLFRAINDDMVRASGAAARRVALIVCECESEDCGESLEVGIGEYERVREHANRFLVASGHQDGQRVLTKNRRFVVVESIPAPHAVEAADAIRGRILPFISAGSYIVTAPIGATSSGDIPEHSPSRVSR